MKVYTVDCWKEIDDSYLIEETKYFLDEGTAKQYEYFMGLNMWKSKIDTCNVINGVGGYFRLIPVSVKIEESTYG
jgi:hypothetical protein